MQNCFAASDQPAHEISLNTQIDILITMFVHTQV